MNEPTKLDLVSGEIVMLTSTETERQTLIDVCESNEIKFTWQEMTPNNALRLALKEQCRGQLVRKSKKGFVVVNEQLDDDGNEYETQEQFYCSVDDIGEWIVGTTSSVSGGCDPLVIHRRVQELKTRLMAGVVTNPDATERRGVLCAERPTRTLDKVRDRVHRSDGQHDSSNPSRLRRKHRVGSNGNRVGRP